MTMLPTPGKDIATIVLVNPNTNTATTTMMAELAGANLTGMPPATVRGITVARGPAMIVAPRALSDAASAVVERIGSLGSGSFHAVIVAAVGDPGRGELERTLRVPVVGIGQAAVREAAARGRRFAMATTTPELTGSLRRLVERQRAGENFAGVFLTRDAPLALAVDPEEQYRQLLEATEAAAEAGARAVIIAGGPLSDTARRIRAVSRVSVVEPVPAAVRLVESRLLAAPALRDGGG